MSCRNRVGGCGLDSSCPGYEPVAGFCEHCNETSGSIKGEESRVAERLLACQVRVCSMQLVV
jgi:hypothetical protein